MSIFSGLPVLILHVHVSSVVALSSNTTFPTEPPVGPTFVYHSTAVEWETAAESCRNQSSDLAEFRNATVADTTWLKRFVHITPGSDVWTGDYNTFEVVTKPTRMSRAVSSLQCVSATLADVRALKNSLRYEFNFTLTDCNQLNKYICTCQSATNTTTLRLDKGTSADWENAYRSCPALDNRCMLWTPHLTLYKTSIDSLIGHANFLLQHNDNKLNLRDKFWSGIRIKTNNGSGQVLGNLLECGYITYMHNQTRILYGTCNQRKGFVCENGTGSIKDMGTENMTPAESKAPGSTSGWVYAVVIVMLIAIGGGITGVLIYRKRKRHESDKVKLSQGSVSRPQGGRSFRPGPDNAETKCADSKIPDNNRMSTYAQINPGDLDTRATTPYTSVPFSKPANRPNTVQTATSSGYLPMDGRVPNPDGANAEHDGSYNTLCHSIRENTESFEESTNVYGAASGDIDLSTYDSTDPCGSSNDLDDYDDVLVSRTDPMHNRVCDSDVVRQNTANMSSHNPVYEDMHI